MGLVGWLMIQWLLGVIYYDERTVWRNERGEKARDIDGRVAEKCVEAVDYDQMSFAC